ncbi:hypothetical protein AAE02nite_33550 [Adhaeribacter aerolatus]|uniref:Uncharacterized protein n=1 Tax=Adhaeribacter aerolatus TaxID=670289 RepID=A0A512B153_9BACT|nr:hypothetical protein [Adhaeribacter aerolatus]GEO05691.1 hypothetical protein AAE02nite_33550 [Adhaeribacter aerolatus]
MNNLDTTRIAATGMLIILSLIILFHLLVMVGIIPYDMVWGGRLKNSAQMLSFEAISILLNLIMLAVVGIKAGVFKVNIHRTIIQVALWAMFGLFLLNTLGNLLSQNELEKLIFTPLTLLLAVFSLRLALSKEPKVSY